MRKQFCFLTVVAIAAIVQGLFASHDAGVHGPAKMVLTGVVSSTEEGPMEGVLDEGPRASGRNTGFFASTVDGKGGGASGSVAAIRGLGADGFEARFDPYAGGLGVRREKSRIPRKL